MRVAGYRLGEQVGTGGTAMVFAALDERLRRQVALKVLAPEWAADDAFRQRFIRESRAVAAVDEPHILPVYEAGEDDGVLFIAMRLVAGGDLRSLLRREGSLTPAATMKIISRVASALDAAHAAGLVHRDVKPGNVLLDTRPGRPDQVYLADFGICRKVEESVQLTQTGQFLGTLDYAAPEQIRGAHVDGQADQYALACLAFEMLAGTVPFARPEPCAVLWAHMSTAPPSLARLRPEIPRPVDHVLARALNKVPQHRYTTCKTFSDALREALARPPNAAPIRIPPYQSRAPLPSPVPGTRPSMTLADLVKVTQRLRASEGS